MLGCLQSIKDKFQWNPYILTPLIEKFDSYKYSDRIEAKLKCKWRRDDNSDQYVSGLVLCRIYSNGVVELSYDIKPSEKATDNFLECGLTLQMNEDFDVFRWLGKGPFSSTPGKTAYNERDIWALHKNDIRFIGNRSFVDIAVVTNQQKGIGLWSSNGNIGVENINNSIFVSQNAIVTSYGSKFTHPKGLTPMADLKKIEGKLVLFINNPSNSEPFLNSIFKNYPMIVPEQPYLMNYGW